MESLIRDSYLIRWGTPPPGLCQKREFCGLPRSKNSICPNCQVLMMRHAGLDLTDPVFGGELKPLDWLDLLFCWKCNVAHGSFFYHAQMGGEVTILDYKKGSEDGDSPSEDFPYDDYPGWFLQTPLWLEDLPKEIQELRVKHFSYDWDDRSERARSVSLKAIDSDASQIGGVPFLWNFPDKRMVCPICHADMKFFAVFSNESTDPRGFACDGVHVVYEIFAGCRVIGVWQEID